MGVTATELEGFALSSGSHPQVAVLQTGKQCLIIHNRHHFWTFFCASALTSPVDMQHATLWGNMRKNASVPQPVLKKCARGSLKLMCLKAKPPSLHTHNLSHFIHSCTRFTKAHALASQAPDF